MTRKEVIVGIKARIKERTEKQKGEKAILRKDHREYTGDIGCLMYDVFMRRIEITALLNLYHEVRESAHRHGVSEEDAGRYDALYRRLKEEFQVEPVAV